MVVVVSVVIATGIVTILSEMGFLLHRSALKLLKPEDIYTPTEIIDDNFGLFFYDDDGNRIRTTNKNVPFDVNKPVIIYAHGMSKGFGIDNPEGFNNYKKWQQNGYNVGCFVWSQFADDSPFLSERKVWGSKKEDMRFLYRNNQGKEVYETSDLPQYSMAQAFVAYYYDFISKSGFQGSEIRFQGMSLGAQLITASCSYLMALEQNNVIDKSFFPDRVTLFDAFFTNIKSDVYIDWLKREVGPDGSAALALDTVKLLRSKGVAVEYIRSSPVEITTKMGTGSKSSFSDMLKETVYLDYNSDWLGAGGGLTDIMNGMEAKHCIGLKWYNKMISYPLPADFSAKGSGQYGISPNTPTSFAYARMGTAYSMHSNYTLDPSDDVQYSTNVNVPFVAGFAFVDENKNGNYDERLKSRVDEVKVELYLKEEGGNKLIGVTRSRNGYYQLPIEPIYITHTDGKEFFVKVRVPEGYVITPSKGDSDKYYMMTNNINENHHSESFFIYSKKELKIINIGIIRK